MVLELWHLPSKNMVGSWITAEAADAEIRRGLAGRDADVLVDHALRKLRLVDEMRSALDRSASVRDVLVRETLAIYACVTGSEPADDVFREHLEGFVAGRIAEGAELTVDDGHGFVKKAG